MIHLPEPYYSDELATIYLADCAQIIDELTFDSIVTDPPYGISITTKNRSNKRSNLTQSYDFPEIVGDNQPFDPSFLLEKNVPTVLFGANHYCDKLPGTSHWLVWDKLDGMKSTKRTYGVFDTADCELAWSNLKGPARLFQHRWVGMLKASERREKRVHPTQKPIALMEWVLLQVPGDCVLDPFMGSGPTLIAAKRVGRRSIGIEIEESYCETAAKRLANE